MRAGRLFVLEADETEDGGIVTPNLYTQELDSLLKAQKALADKEISMN